MMKTMALVPTVAALVILAAVPATATAEERVLAGIRGEWPMAAEPAEPEAEPWGTATSAARTIHALAFQPADGATTYTYSAITTHRIHTGGLPWFDAAVELPAGAELNGGASYFARIEMTGVNDTTSVGAVRIYYRLRVSAAPATATFTDVPTTHPFFRFVEALSRAGITGGCGGGNFCPNDPITRGQMAVFLSSALGLHFPN